MQKNPHFHKIGCALGTWHLALCPWPHFEIEGFWNSEVAYFKMFLDEIWGQLAKFGGHNSTVLKLFNFLNEAPPLRFETVAVPLAAGLGAFLKEPQNDGTICTSPLGG